MMAQFVGKKIASMNMVLRSGYLGYRGIEQDTEVLSKKYVNNAIR